MLCAEPLTADRVVCHWLTPEKGRGPYAADDVLEGMRLQYREQFISAMHAAARTGTGGTLARPPRAVVHAVSEKIISDVRFARAHLAAEAMLRVERPVKVQRLSVKRA